MDFYSNSIINTLFIEPYNYISTITDDMIISIQENTSNTYQIINDTIETSFNNMDSYNIDYIDYMDYINYINYMFDKYTLYLYISLLFSTILFYYKYKDIKHYFNFKNNKLNIVKNNEPNTTTNNVKTKGIFIDSILDMNNNNKYIIENIKKNNNTNYYALLRIKLQQPIEMKKSKYKLENIHVNDKNVNKFTTNDMYMIIKFNYDITDNINIINYIDENNKPQIHYKNFSRSIINVMNLLNKYSKKEYINTDFVVLAISKENYINPNEFYNGLININYELFNMKNISIDIHKKMGFMLLLPIKEIYDLFMDVYNNIIFESTSYKINYDNNEILYDNSIYDIL